MYCWGRFVEMFKGALLSHFVTTETHKTPPFLLRLFVWLFCWKEERSSYFLWYVFWKWYREKWSGVRKLIQQRNNNNWAFHFMEEKRKNWETQVCVCVCVCVCFHCFCIFCFVFLFWCFICFHPPLILTQGDKHGNKNLPLYVFISCLEAQVLFCEHSHSWIPRARHTIIPPLKVCLTSH